MKKKLIICLLILIIISAFGFYFYKDKMNKTDKKVIEEKTSVKENLTIELGEEIDNNNYFNKLIDETIKEVKILKDNKTIKIIEIGSYDVEIVTDKNLYKTKLNVKDTTKPDLKLKELEINENESYDIVSFIESCIDNSNKDCAFEYKDEEMSKYVKEGTYNITVIASDENFNKIEEDTKLIITRNKANNNIRVENKNVGDSNNTNTTKQVEVNEPKTSESISENKEETRVEPKTSENIVENEEMHVESTPPKTYQVKFVSDDDTIVEIVEVIEGQKVNEISGKIYDGKKFKEWQLSGKKYDFNTLVYSNLTLKAVYEYEEVVTYKYGVKISTIGKNVKYDYSTFNASTSDLKSEATSVSNSNSAVYQELLGYVNKLREEEGSSVLVLDNTLSVAATTRAIEMAWANKFSHSRPNGTSYFTIISEYNIQAYAVGENIAAGQTTAKAVLNTWNNSKGHHANMVNKNFTKIGIGKYTLNGYTYWVQLFIK